MWKTQKTMKNSNFNLGEIDKSREMYSKEGDNSSQFEGKTVSCEHTITWIFQPSNHLVDALINC